MNCVKTIEPTVTANEVCSDLENTQNDKDKSPNQHKKKRPFLEQNWDNFPENFEEIDGSSTPKKKQKQLDSSSESTNLVFSGISRNLKDSFMEILSLKSESQLFLTPPSQETKKDFSDHSFVGSDKSSKASKTKEKKWNSLHTSIDLGEAGDVKSELFSDKSFTDIENHLSDSSVCRKKKKKDKQKNNGSFIQNETLKDVNSSLHLNDLCNREKADNSTKENDELKKKKKKSSEDVDHENHLNEETLKHKKENSLSFSEDPKNEEVNDELTASSQSDSTHKKKKKKEKKRPAEDDISQEQIVKPSNEIYDEHINFPSVDNNIHIEENGNGSKETKRKHKRKREKQNTDDFTNSKKKKHKNTLQNKEMPISGTHVMNGVPKNKKSEAETQELNDNQNQLLDSTSEQRKKKHKKKNVPNGNSDVISETNNTVKNKKSKGKTQKLKGNQNQLSESPQKQIKKEHKKKDLEHLKKLQYEKSWEELQIRVGNEQNSLNLASVGSADLKRKHREEVKKFFEDKTNDTLDNSTNLPKLDVSLDDLVKEIKESSVLSAEDTQSLMNLKIVLPWPVPPLHLIETRVANRPSSIQKAEIDALQVNIKTGIFSKEEDKRIKKNWKKFCQLHDLPQNPRPFLMFRTTSGKKLFPTEERIKFVRYLAHGLNDRMLCSVYKRFKKIFANSSLVVGRFSPREDQTIIDFIKTTTSKTPYADLGKLLNRDKLSIERRCATLVEQMKGNPCFKWNRDNIEEFMKHFVDVLKVKNVEDLKSREVTTQEWKEMQERLNVPAQKLRDGWLCTLYPKFFTERRTTSVPAKLRLISLLIERGENDWRSVDWDSVAKDLSTEIQGYTGKKLMKMMKHMTHYHVHISKRHDLEECLKHLKTIKGSKLRGQKIKNLKVIDNRGQ